MLTDTVWPGHSDTWFPDGYYGDQIEGVSRSIVIAARDLMLEDPDGVLEVRFVSFKNAQDIVNCLNERYYGAHGVRIHVTMLS